MFRGGTTPTCALPGGLLLPPVPSPTWGPATAACALPGGLLLPPVPYLGVCHCRLHPCHQCLGVVAAQHASRMLCLAVCAGTQAAGGQGQDLNVPGGVRGKISICLEGEGQDLNVPGGVRGRGGGGRVDVPGGGVRGGGGSACSCSLLCRPPPPTHTHILFPPCCVGSARPPPHLLARPPPHLLTRPPPHLLRLTLGRSRRGRAFLASRRTV